MSSETFARELLQWFDQAGRKNLPWQHNPTPYRVWVSEIMLQQTQVATVIPYFQRFMAAFPGVAQLAKAPLDAVLSHWAGLGYYARGRNLHKAAGLIITEFNGRFPCGQVELESLPGIGRSTAGAIRAIACDQQAAILDGNVKRVLARVHAVSGWPGKAAVQKELWTLAEQHTPASRIADYTQAIMDLGATLCRRSKPDCPTCPLDQQCSANQQGNPEAYPGSKPRKVKPVRICHMLMLRNASGGILLERRPNSGIWGGLWSLPELNQADLLEHYLEQNYQLKINNHAMLQPRQHQFTHFTLQFTPILVEVENVPNRVKEMASNARVWYKAGQALPGGLPAPIATLLAQGHPDRHLS